VVVDTSDTVLFLPVQLALQLAVQLLTYKFFDIKMEMHETFRRSEEQQQAMSVPPTCLEVNKIFIFLEKFLPSCHEMAVLIFLESLAKKLYFRF